MRITAHPNILYLNPSMRSIDALTESHDPTADAAWDIATAAYWLTHPDTPPRRKQISDLITQWETEPEWSGEEPSCPE